MNKAEKTAVVEELSQVFGASQGVILINFEKINVPNITELRRKIGESNSQYRVVKNTLALRAADGTAVQQVREHFQGPTAIAYTQDDVIALAKVLKEFVKSNAGMSFKAGVLDGKVISDVQVQSLAEIPSREQLLMKLLFLMNEPLSQFLRALRSPVQKLAFLLKQLEAKKSQA